MNERLEKVMEKSLGVTVSDVENMTDEELDKLYDKACDNEVDKAMEAGDGVTQESNDAADIVDWLWEKIA